MTEEFEVPKLVDGIIGQLCSRMEVGRMRSLNLGFGQEVGVVSKLSHRCYRQWEIGTYRGAWRVTRAGTIVCGSQDAVDSIAELNAAFAQLELGKLTSLKRLSLFDVRLEFDSGFDVDFLAANSDEDEYFHIFCPDGLYVELTVRNGWKVDPAVTPWSESGHEVP